MLLWLLELKLLTELLDIELNVDSEAESELELSNSPVSW